MTEPAPAAPTCRRLAAPGCAFGATGWACGAWLLFVALVGLACWPKWCPTTSRWWVRYEGQWYFPLVKSYPEKLFGGDFETETDYLDPFIRQQFSQPGNWAIYPPSPYGAKTINYFAKSPNPSAPSRDNWLGTDDRGRDLLAQLIYGFRVSVLFALALTASWACCWAWRRGGAGLFGGKTDLAFQRFIGSGVPCPSCTCSSSSAPSWRPAWAAAGAAQPVRLDGPVGLRAPSSCATASSTTSRPRAPWACEQRPDHLAPHPAQQHDAGGHLLPFRMSAAILALTSLDFLGLGVPPGTPAWVSCSSQGKNNIDAWWISISTFGVLVLTLLLLTFMGALRDALDPRKTQ